MHDDAVTGGGTCCCRYALILRHDTPCYAAARHVAAAHVDYATLRCATPKCRRCRHMLPRAAVTLFFAADDDADTLTLMPLRRHGAAEAMPLFRHTRLPVTHTLRCRLMPLMLRRLARLYRYDDRIEYMLRRDVYFCRYATALDARYAIRDKMLPRCHDIYEADDAIMPRYVAMMPLITLLIARVAYAVMPAARKLLMHISGVASAALAAAARKR